LSFCNLATFIGEKGVKYVISFGIVYKTSVNLHVCQFEYFLPDLHKSALP